jgi:hypothetical protein
MLEELATKAQALRRAVDDEERCLRSGGRKPNIFAGLG